MSAGKGDRPRPVDKKKFDNNYKKIFDRKNGLLGYQSEECKDCLKKMGVKKFKKIY